MTDLFVSDGTTVLNFWNLLFGIAVRFLLIFLLVLMSLTIYMLNSISTSLSSSSESEDESLKPSVTMFLGDTCCTFSDGRTSNELLRDSLSGVVF